MLMSAYPSVQAFHNPGSTCVSAAGSFLCEQEMLSGSLAFDRVALEVADLVGSPGSSSSFSRVTRLSF